MKTWIAAMLLAVTITPSQSPWQLVVPVPHVNLPCPAKGGVIQWRLDSNLERLVILRYLKTGNIQQFIDAMRMVNPAYAWPVKMYILDCTLQA